MTDTVTSQYNAYPYPARDPKDEAKRLVIGSPSHPVEIDHHLFSGSRDWSQPFRALVAGGGTGDALVQMAQILTSAKRPYEITYLDLSTSAREIAEARIAARGLSGVRFVTGDLTQAAEHGPFDYIDCCGVLHHLPDPGVGLSALAAALAPRGGLGFMVYAPYGRSGVYPLQEAFSSLAPDASPEERLKLAKAVLPTLPEHHPFRRNGLVGDHMQSDAGLYDLLLHQQDMPFTIDAWVHALEEAGFAHPSMITPGLYDLSMITPVPEDMDQVMAMAVAEKLRGVIRKHVGYATLKGQERAPAGPLTLSEVPHISGNAKDMAKAISKGATLKFNAQGVGFNLKVPQSAAAIIGRVDGRRSLSEIATSAKLDPIAFQRVWDKLHDPLTKMGVLTYSRIFRA
ncbi:class I SAM-dependent methyltransferase [Shimia ponticola]|uniref:class I SAM-dependent methyltransferase n=1 Tax=Shimia ponticola TaxID=2582893 RepID=UPI0011BF788E|nr:class I SAM-dependent methyltransferase [Shimia ponticola]